MTRKYVTISFISALGAFGLIHLVFSLIGSYGYLMGISGAFIVFALSVLTMAAGFRRRTAVLLIFFMTFPTALLLSYGTLYQSALSASIPFIQNLNEAYNLDMEVPKLLIRFSPLPARTFLLMAISWIFFYGSTARLGRVIATLLSLAAILFSFYFGFEPPTLSIILLGAYALTTPAMLGNKGQGDPEVGAFIAAVILGAALSLVIPPSRYEQPRLLARAQDTILSMTDPYDPIFYAGNAYTGMMKGAGTGKLGDTQGVRYTGRIIADIESVGATKRMYLRSWHGSVYKDNQWKELPAGDYDDVLTLFKGNQGEWYDQGAWLMEVVSRSPALSQSLENYLPERVKVPLLKKDFAVDAVYDKSRYFLLPYDASFGAPLFDYDRAPVSREGKAYSTYVWDYPEGAVLSFYDNERTGDAYLRTYENGEALYRNFVYAHYLTVPDEVKPALKQVEGLTKVTTMAEKRVRVEQIQRFFAKNYKYTTHPGKTPEGKDFISYFLTESREGYCTYFASAAVMMLRESGIPARYVSGLSVDKNEINGASLSPQGLHKLGVNDRHAHAWAEVYVDGIGWRPCEVTPGIEGSENPFPNPEDKKRNNTGAPDAPSDPKDSKGTMPDNNGQKDQQQQQQSQSQPQPKEQPASKQAQQVSPRSSLLPVIIPVIIFFLLLSLYPIMKIRRVPKILDRAVKDKKGFNDLLDYISRLSLWAGIPENASYEEMKKLSLDPRFENFDRMLDILIHARFSGRPLSEEERMEVTDIVRAARIRCLEKLSFFERIKLRVKGIL